VPCSGAVAVWADTQLDCSRQQNVVVIRASNVKVICTPTTPKQPFNSVILLAENPALEIFTEFCNDVRITIVRETVWPQRREI